VFVRGGAENALQYMKMSLPTPLREREKEMRRSITVEKFFSGSSYI